MKLPQKYSWLEKEPGPKMLLEALKLYGTLEVHGPNNNPVILAWARSLDLHAVYTSDSIPWCGLAMAIVANNASKEIPKDPLWALNWAKFGSHVDEPMLGDILVFKREGGGHVTMYIGEDNTAYHCLGGNQSDAFGITRILKNRLYAARRYPYNILFPNVRKVYLSNLGVISNNES